MAKKAFVIGANSTKLDYAESDAEKISRALSHLGYEVDDLIATTEESYQVVQRFRKFAATCKQYDTLIFYFAGHGVSHNNTLYLALNSSKFDDITSSAIPITDITTTLNSTTAQNRLIILDCCEASSENLVIGNAENYQVLRATEKWQRASEFEELRAGFLSFHLHKLLTEPVARHLLNENYGLTFNTLLQELRKQVQQHNQKNPDKIVPKFVREGKDNNEYEIATFTPQYAGLLAITPQFIEQERDKHLSDDSYSFEQFYGANSNVQWWGIINGLVAERAIYTDIKDHINKVLSKKINKPIITLILGSGGMGKSTLLRQLAIDLSTNHNVFWLDDWETFQSENIADSLAISSGYPLICLDNWHRLADEDKKSIKKWLNHNNFNSKIKWLITDRKEAKELSEFSYAKSEFNFDSIKNIDKAQDNKLLINIVADKIPAWKDFALELQHHDIAKTKPFQILFILYRWAGKEEKINFDDFETSFHKIIKDDIEELQSNKQLRGFADALIDFASLFIDLKVRLTKATFLRLADYYHGDTYLSSCYQMRELDEDIWGILRYYINIHGVTRKLVDNNEATFLKFVTEDLAETIVDNFGEIFAQRKHLVCRRIIDDKNKFSASEMLYAATVNHVFDNKTILSFIKKLLDRKNPIDTYLHPIFNSTLAMDISSKEREELFEQFIAINPTSSIIHNYLNFLGKTEAGKQKANELLHKTHNKSVTYKCFKILGKTDLTQQKAIELLDETQNTKDICKYLSMLDNTIVGQQKSLELLDKNKSIKVVCKCLDMLKDTEIGRQKASELLVETEDNKIIDKCFDILGKTDATRDKASELLNKIQDKEAIFKYFDILGKTDATREKASELLGKTRDNEIICKCLDILGKTEEIKQKAVELLKQENQTFQIVCKCFAILGKNEQAKEHARQFLLQSDNEPILAWCVNILEEEAKQFALKRLENWETLEPKLRLLQNCLYVCRNEKQIEEIAEAIIRQKTDSKPSMQRYISVLKLPLTNIPLWQQETTIILADWKKCNPAFVGASLLGNRNDLPKVKQTCQDILLDWEREISYQQEKGYTVYHFHIFKALSYPSTEDPVYRQLIETTANTMLAKEKQDSGFLGDMLYEAAYNIVHHQQYPAWIPEEDI